MATVLDRIREFTMRKKQEERSLKMQTWRTVFWQTACETVGRKIAKPELLSTEDGARLMESVPLDVNVEGTVDLIVRRLNQESKVANIDALFATAEAAEQAIKDFEKQECERVRIALERRPALREAEHFARVAYIAAVEAREDLISTADESPEEQALSAQLTEIGRAIEVCKAALNRLTGESSASKARAARAALEACPKNATAQQRDELEKRIAYHEKAVADNTKQLAGLEQQRAAIHAKLAKLTEAKLRPENFKIIRRQPARTMERMAIA